MRKISIVVIMVSVLLSCSTGPEPIKFGEDNCAYCKMTIIDPKFGAETVTEKGKIYKFDALECLIPFINEQQGTYSQILAIPFDDPGKLKEKEQLLYVFSPHVISPMGANLAAFSADVDPGAFIEPDGMKLMNWDELNQVLLLKRNGV